MVRASAAPSQRPLEWLKTASESTLAPLRRQERQRRITALRQRLHDTLGPNDCSVWLYSCGEAFGYGSLARGDWDCFSDIDLLVVAANPISIPCWPCSPCRCKRSQILGPARDA